MAAVPQPSVVTPYPLQPESPRNQSLNTLPPEHHRQRVRSPSPQSSFSDRTQDGPTSAAPYTLRNHSNYSHHSSSPSTSSSTRNQRSASGIFSLAVAALDRTQTAIANISEPVLRHRSSNSGLSRLSIVSGTFQTSDLSGFDKRAYNKLPSSNLPDSESNVEIKQFAPTVPAKDPPPSQPYSQTDPGRPPLIKFTPSSAESKMHQTSSRLLRMTDDDRPFTRVSTPHSAVICWLLDSCAALDDNHAWSTWGRLSQAAAQCHAVMPCHAMPCRATPHTTPHYITRHV
jgi:hypothetical protein